MTPQRFPDQFLPSGEVDPLVAEWATAEAGDLPPAVLDALDPFALRDRIAWYDDRHAHTASALLRAVLDRTVAWQAGHALPAYPGQGGGGRR